MKYIIIGLGNYGGVLAEELSVLGHEVIGVDTNEHRVDVLKDKIATSFIIDATDEQSLSVLPLKDVDVVIVAIGENFGASVRVVALLKKKGVKHIYARAVDDVHKTVLEAFNLDSILTPEKEAARSLVRLLDLHVNVESFQIDEEHYVMKFKLPSCFVGYKVSDLSLETEFNMSWKKKISWSAMGFIRILWIFGRRCSRNAFQRKNIFFLSEIKPFLLGLV